MTKTARIVLTVAAATAGILLFLLTGVLLARAMGRRKIEAGAETAAPVFEETGFSEPVTEEEKRTVEWQEGWVKYGGRIYAYNSDIRSFLIMGIDKQGEVEEVAEGTDGGQADALILAVMNPHEERIKLIAINRNTMAKVDVYNEEGDFVKTVLAQIAIQHGFGNGLEESCEYQKRTVERFLYQLPIHGYAAVNMSSVARINDAVGGVDVTVAEDLTKWDKSLVEGAEIHLMGETAYVYTTRRDVNKAGSADGRLARQKQYLSAFMKQAASLIREKPAAALELYRIVSDEMTTDLTMNEAVWLMAEAAGYSFDEDGILTLKGRTVLGESGYEEFYADEEALYRMLIDVFYEEVKTGNAA